ncbi:hypothetical protein V2J09_017564 [Rumex salicifolius]
MGSYSYKMFLCFTRKFKISDARPPVDVNEAFGSYTDGGAFMSAVQLRQFLVEVQGLEPADAESESNRIVQEMTQKRRHLSIFAKQQGLTLEDFFFYLFDCDLNGPNRTQVHNDMTAPLQHYFIYTGHNSYLTGNQLSSDCSDVPIIKALQRGVRVIELDIWPNSAKDNINVLHGRTLTAPVPLIKCLKSIRDHAFATSPYPVVITLEDHLTADLQAKVAKMLTETFGEMLYYPQSGSLENVPSPEELKYKIIISTKPPKEYLEAKQEKDKEETSQARNSSDGEPEYQDAQGDETPNDSDSDSDEEETDTFIGKSNSAPEYRRLIAIHAGKPKHGLKHALTSGIQKVRRLSLSEQALERATTEYAKDVVSFTQKNFLRIYPKGTRIRSSNYQPLVAWSHGAQMVAFNMQGYGSSLWLMHGMFRSNGGCGYVKKPEILMKKDDGSETDVFNPKISLPVKQTLKVSVYMGDGWHMDFSKTHFDAYSPPDFYTKLQVVGVPADCKKKKTKVIEDDWTPIWNADFLFHLTVPELALLRIEVREYDVSEKDDFGGQTCLPICEIKQGFRAVPLFDKRGDKLPNAKLLMKFEFI